MSDPRPTPKAPVGSLRALWPFVRAHRGLFFAWLVALAVSSTATLSLPIAFRQMIDSMVNGGKITFTVHGGGNCDLKVTVLDELLQVIAEFNDQDNLGVSEKTVSTTGNKVYLRVEADPRMMGDLMSQAQMAGQYTLVVKR